MNRPYIICHMVMSIDGKVTGDFLFRDEVANATDIYYEINRQYKADAFACGRVTMEGSFTGGWYPVLSQFNGICLPFEDFIADFDAKFFAVSFDRKGRLGWKTSEIVDDDPGYGGAHIIEVLTENVDTRYLSYLQSVGVSYIFAGKEELNLLLALEKLKNLFGINRLLLEGGSIINGAFQRENLVDELSLVTAPVIAGKDCKPLFMDSNISEFKLTKIKNYENGVIWTIYKK